MPPFSSIINLYCLTTWQSLSTHPLTFLLLHTLPPVIFLLLIHNLLLFSALVILDHPATRQSLFTHSFIFLFPSFFFLPAFSLTLPLLSSFSPPLLSSFSQPLLSSVSPPLLSSFSPPLLSSFLPTLLSSFSPCPVIIKIICHNSFTCSCRHFTVLITPSTHEMKIMHLPTNLHTRTLQSLSSCHS